MERREYIATLATAGAFATAGCGELLDRSAGRSGPAGERADERIEGTWPMTDFDAGRTRRAGASGPGDDLRQRWEQEDHTPRPEPIIGDSLVYTSNNRRVRTLEASTGEWVETPLDGESGVVRALTEEMAILAEGDREVSMVRGVDREDGSERWRASLSTDNFAYIDYVAIVEGDVVVHGIETSVDGWLFSAASIDAHDGTVRETTTLRERIDEQYRPYDRIACTDDLLVAAVGDRLIARSLPDLERLWTDSLDVLGSPLVAGPTVADERVLVGTEDNRLVAVDLNGEFVWDAKFGSRVEDLAVGDERVYVATSSVDVFDIRSGDLRDSFPDVPGKNLALGDDTLYTAAGGDLSSLDPETGEERATLSVETTTAEMDHGYSFDTAQLNDIAVVDDMLFVSRPDHSDDPSTILAIGPDERR